MTDTNSFRTACFKNDITRNQLLSMKAASGAYQGTTWYVDANVDTTGDGKSWEQSLPTMAAAFAKLSSGDSIIFRGKIKEQLETPHGVFDVTVIGAGNRPRHCDDTTPSGGELAANSWASPATPVDASPLVLVQQQGWRFENILFYSGAATGACIELTRSAEGTGETDASHLEVVNCRFASGYNGISDTGGCYGVLIYGCRFAALTNYCILGVGNIGAGQGCWVVEDNHFYGFTNGVKCAFSQSRIKGNTFSDGGTPNTTVVLNTVNAIQGENFVVENYFQTATANFNTPDVVGNATDVWNNTSIDGTTNFIGREVGQPA